MISQYLKTRFIWSGYSAKQEREWKELRDYYTSKILKKRSTT